MKITDLRATTVTMPLEAPLRHSNGAHWGRFVRTIVEVETDEGLIGVGEMGGGGQSAEQAIAGLKPYLVGHDPLQLEQLRWKIMNPVASLYNNRTQLHAAIEFACIDLAGKKLGIRACDLLGGAVREEVALRELHLLSLPRPRQRARRRDHAGRDRRPRPRPRRPLRLQDPQAEGRALRRPTTTSRCIRALGAAFPEDGLRLDPNSVWSVEEAIRVGKAIEDLNNDYFEDPAWGLEGMRRVRQFDRHPDRDQHGGGQFRAARRLHPRSRRSTSSSSTPPSGAGSARPTRPARCSRPSSSAPACTPRASSASSSPPCSTSARRCPTSPSPPTPTTTTSPTT